MNIVTAGHELITPLNGEAILKRIETCARTCYKSEGRITQRSAAPFVASLIKRGHEAMLEHISFTVRFICDRGVSHELVRHRLASYAQESTRYCKYDDAIEVIAPCFWPEDSSKWRLWAIACENAERTYQALLREGASPQEARAVLPHSLKTEVVMTANGREWRHFLRLRTAPDAHPQMRELTIPLLNELKSKIPVLFDDIGPETKQ